MTVANGSQIPGKITVTRHAIDEAIKDFRVPRQTAEEWVRSNLRKAQFIANIVSADGNPTRLFGYNRIAFAVDPVDDRVITVYKNSKPKASIRDRVNRIITAELRKAERKETKLERFVRLTKAELAVEIAQLELRLLRAKSEATKLACQARINVIYEYYTQLDGDLMAAKHEKRAVAKTVVAYL